jgi:hypothetical protein
VLATEIARSLVAEKFVATFAAQEARKVKSCGESVVN